MRVRATCHKSKLYHEGAVAERMLAAAEREAGAVATSAAGGDDEAEGRDEQLFLVRFLHDRAVVSVDASGALTSGRVRRAVVRSRAQLDYPAAQAALDGGPLAEDDPLVLLRAAGTDLLAAEVARGGVSLPLPEQVVLRSGGGGYELAWRSPLPVEQWNAQLSLLCGRAAANLMLQGGVGLLRTLPRSAVRRLGEVRPDRVVGP